MVIPANSCITHELLAFVQSTYNKQRARLVHKAEL